MYFAMRSSIVGTGASLFGKRLRSTRWRIVKPKGSYMLFMRIIKINLDRLAPLSNTDAEKVKGSPVRSLTVSVLILRAEGPHKHAEMLYRDSRPFRRISRFLGFGVLGEKIP